MKSWYESILSDFVKGVSKITLVADPDSILSDERLLLELNSRGFQVETYQDSVEFRYVYESKYREQQQQNPELDLVMVVNCGSSALPGIPYDLLSGNRKIALNLGELFPNLSYPVLESLDRSLLSDLYNAQSLDADARLGDISTSDFVLRHVFHIAHEMIRDDIMLLRELLRVHYSDLKIPEPLARRLATALSSRPIFREWPLFELIASEKAFYEFLQERWPVFVNQLDKSSVVHEGSLAYSGPPLLAFDHQDIRVYIDNLFVEGKLKPITKPEGLTVAPDSLIRCGIIEDADADLEQRIKRLFHLVDNQRPTQQSRYQDWMAFAFSWAELLSLVYRSASTHHRQKVSQLSRVYNEDFSAWLQTHISNLASLPPLQPIMVHHMARYLARASNGGTSRKIALVVIDGLALDQWVSMKVALNNSSPDLNFLESTVFAWVPTVTAVSRQAIFAGKAPFFFPRSIGDNNSEAALWQQFWEDTGLSKSNVLYRRGVRDQAGLADLKAELHPDSTKVVGIVIDTVDKITHGMQLGAAGMHNQIMQWCDEGLLVDLIQYLHRENFEVWLTSDHGNVECEGIGRPTEGAKAISRGERVRVFSSSDLRTQVARNFTTAIVWEPAGLPPDYYPLVAGSGTAFKNPGCTLISHGGVSLEEVLVPFVKVEISE